MTGRKVEDHALDWAIRAADPDFDDWDGLTAWLEADPLNPDRYDDATVAIAEARDRVAALPVQTAPAPAAPVQPAPVQAVPVAANDAGAARRGYWRWGGGAVAAMLAVVVGTSVWNGRSQPYAVETRPGEQRAIALADGSQIIMAGGSRVTLDRANARVAVADRGEMLFRVRHDAAHPFRVMAGETTMVDLGTVFDVKRDPQRTRVAVAEGAVMIDPKGAELRLDPGQAVVVTGGRSFRRERAEDVGGWREGRVTFDGASLSDVARDLSRQMGHAVRADASVADRLFSGTVDLRSLNDDPALLGRLLAVNVRTDGQTWVLGGDR